MCGAFDAGHDDNHRLPELANDVHPRRLRGLEQELEIRVSQRGVTRLLWMT